MAEFKTAEQYVVEKVEMLERELDQAQLTHEAEMKKVCKALDSTKAELASAYELLNIFRDIITVRKDNYWHHVIGFDNIYGKEHPEEVARIMEYYDIQLDEEDDDNE